MTVSLRPYQSELLNSTLDAFRAGYKRPLVVLACGGGKTACFASMAESSQAKGNTVWFLVHRRELLEQTIATFSRFSIPLDRIHIGMVGTVANNIKRFPAPDLIVFDEAHFSAARTWQRIIEAFPTVPIVGLTATPCRLDGKPLGETYDTLVIGKTTNELINDGYLAPYRYYAPVVADLSALKRRGSDYDASQAAELLSERAVFGDVIKHWREHADGLQTICYCSTIKHSKAMADEFQAAGINAVHFDGDTPSSERRSIVDQFRSKEITILCNVDLISVGFDVPDCWCCILLRPTMSTALYIQQSCRALRPQDGKTAIILDHVNNYERHGLPDDDREWSLQSKLPATSQYRDDGKLQIRQCGRCFHVFPTAPICPKCGYKTVLTEREIKNIKEIKLQEVKQRAAKSVQSKQSISECKTLNEIMQWCKLNGKKSGYGYYVAKNRGLL